MSGFSASWLSLREPADHKARNRHLAENLQAHFGLRDTIKVVDLGCGTGSNLRATAEYLPSHQNWQLVDYDAELLIAAKTTLISWADEERDEGDTLKLKKGHRSLNIQFLQADLARDLKTVFSSQPDLVTASALFDLMSEASLRRLTKSVTEHRAVFYTVLTYNGLQKWDPRHPDDNALLGAFHHHQRIDKGFGAAAGPTAPQLLHDQFHASGYRVEEGDSPWNLETSRDKALITELKDGYATAVSETGRVAQETIDMWASRDFRKAVVGHTDTLAIPSHRTFLDDPDDDEDDAGPWR